MRYISPKTRNKRKQRKIILAIAGALAILTVVGAVLLWPAGSDPAADENPPEPPVVQDDVPEYAPYVSAELKAAHAENEDVVGWLVVEGCDIDNRVFQGVDNDEYLRVNEAGESDIWGCYFLDWINVHNGCTALQDKVSIIYGHSLDDYPDSEKFSKLKRYKDADFAAQHPTIRFDLLYAEQEWQVFAACNIPITIDYIDPNPDDSKYQDTLDYMLENSFVDFGVSVSTSDKILVLSTCTSDDNVRFVVAA